MSHRPDKAIAVNVGSSSLKVTGFLGTEQGWQRAFYQNFPLQSVNAPLLAKAFAGAGFGDTEITAIAHRYVHAGDAVRTPAIVDEACLRRLESTVDLAPLHNPPTLVWLNHFRALFPAAIHVVVPDSAFFHDLPDAASRYAIPRDIAERHALRRFGFHGLAHAAMWRRWSDLAGRKEARIVTLQLGAGCSAAAIHNGRPMDTSMGFTPLEGLVMGTRCGDIDAGILVYLQRDGGMNLEAMDDLLNRRSGLLGLAGDDNIQVLLGRQDYEAAIAVDIFCRSVRHYIGAYLAELGGMDALVFSGGIGEHSPIVRERILGPLVELGFDLDTVSNRVAIEGEAIIGKGAIDIRVLPADEAGELMFQAEPVFRSVQ